MCLKILKFQSIDNVEKDHMYQIKKKKEKSV